MVGKVYLVGAGPGDPELITVKALRLIRAADVIVYDRLIPHTLLDEAQIGAKLINAGKEPSRHRLSQETINDEIIQRALEGATVVRLKGGDPFVFGRGGEEALACYQAGIPFEVVPGISSPLAVPAYAGIPVTHRGLSTTVTIIAGYEDPTSPETSVNYAAIAKLGGTLVILMGVERLRDILDTLTRAGLPSNTPAASIEWGTTAHQRVAEGTVETLADRASEMDIQPPAVTIIGEVVRLRSQGIEWFEDLLCNSDLLAQAIPQL